MPRKHTVSPTEMAAETEELAALHRDAERYRWLRARAVRINGSEVWWQGEFLDLRCDTGLGHIQGDYEVVPEATSPGRHLPRSNPKLK